MARLLSALVRNGQVVSESTNRTSEHSSKSLESWKSLESRAQVGKLLQPLVQSLQPLMKILNVGTALPFLEAESDGELDHGFVVDFGRQFKSLKSRILTSSPTEDSRNEGVKVSGDTTKFDSTWADVKVVVVCFAPRLFLISLFLLR